MAINKVIYNSEVLIDVTDCDITEADVAAGKKFIKKNGEKAVGTSTGGGGTSAALGKLNVSANGTYEAGRAITLVPGGLYQYKEVLPKETLAELCTIAEANDGVLFNVFNPTDESMPLTQVTIRKVNEEYVLTSVSFDGFTCSFYATESVEFPRPSVGTISLNAGWSLKDENDNVYPVSTSVVRVPQSLDAMPEIFTSLLELSYDASNEVSLIVDETSSIAIENLGNFYKVLSDINPAKKNLAIASLGGFTEFSAISSQEVSLAILYTLKFRSATMSELQTDIEGLKYLKKESAVPLTTPQGKSVSTLLVYIEDPSKIQITSGNAEAGCWYIAEDMYLGPDMNWGIVCERDLVDGYNKVTVNVPANFTSKTFFSDGNVAVHTLQGLDILSSDPNESITEELILNEGITEVIGGSWNINRSLKRVLLPSTLLSIGEMVFKNCAYLTSIVIPDSVTSIKHQAFYNCDSLTSVTIGNSVAEIGESAFMECDGLTGIIIPDSVTSICGHAFQHCTKLMSAIIGNSVDSIGDYAFQNCRKLTSITIPDSVTGIGIDAFQYCVSLTSASIGNGVRSIGNHAFDQCTSLKSVTISATTPPTLGTNVFTDAAVLTQIIVPAGCGETYKTAANWSAYADYIIEEGMHRVTLGEEVTCSVDGTQYSNQTFDVADQTVIHFEVGQPDEGGVVSATPDGIFLNGALVSDNSGPATYDLTVTGNVSVTYSIGDVIGDITYDHCYKIVMD